SPVGLTLYITGSGITLVRAVNRHRVRLAADQEYIELRAGFLIHVVARKVSPNAGSVKFPLVYFGNLARPVAKLKRHLLKPLVEVSQLFGVGVVPETEANAFINRHAGNRRHGHYH